MSTCVGARREDDPLLVTHAEEKESASSSTGVGEELDEHQVADIMTAGMYKPSGVLQEEEEEEDKGSVNNNNGLKCLDEPAFEFEQPQQQQQQQQQPQQPKRPTYRVLEDPFEEMAARQDPMTSGFYDPSTSSSSNAQAKRPSPKLGHRPPAQEVMEGTREKLDRFWGGGNKGPSGGGPN